MGSYAMNNKFNVMSGISFDKGLYSTFELLEYSSIVETNNDEIIFSISEYQKEPLSISFLSLVVSTKYSIFKQFFIYSDIKLPITGFQGNQWNSAEAEVAEVEDNRYLSLGIGIDL